MFKGKNSLWKDTTGAVLAYTAILMPIFLGFLALGLDIAAWHIEKRQSQSIADAAAVAGAIERFRLKEEDDEDDASCAEGDNVYTAAATTAGFNLYDTGKGQTLTLNCPPQFGDSAGAAGAVEAIVTTPLPLFLASLVNVTAAGKQASSRGVAGAGLGTGCILSLNEDNAGAIDVNGGSTVEIGCGVRSNSDDDDAIRLNGVGSCMDASEILSAGGTNGDCYTPEPVEGINATDDPLANLPEPDNTGCDYNSRRNITGSSNATLNPGVYCNDVSITTSGTVTFNPGIYIFDGAGLNVGSAATVIAHEVMIFFTNGSASNNFTINSGATWDQTAPTSGPYQGIAFYSDRDDDPYNINFTGGANMQITGVIYAPGQDLKFAGGSSADETETYIIADEITFTGESHFSGLDPANPPFFSSYLIQGKLVE